MLAVYHESELVTADGARLHLVEHRVPHAPGTVLLVHGLGEHSGRYDHVVEVLNRSGLSVIRFDHRGHGHSTGERGHVPSYEHFLDDVTAVASKLIDAAPNQKLVLYGHSMGGGIVANWCLRRFNEDWEDRIVGAILSAPWLRLTSPPPVWQLFLIRNISRVLPKFAIPSGIRAKDLSRDEEALRRLREDTLRHGKLTLRTAHECYQAGLWALENAHHCRVPILAIHGTDDRVTCSEATKEFCNAIADARFVGLQNLVHEPHQDPKWREVVYHMTEWTLKRYNFAYAA